MKDIINNVSDRLYLDLTNLISLAQQGKEASAIDLANNIEDYVLESLHDIHGQHRDYVKDMNKLAEKSLDKINEAISLMEQI